MRQVAKCECARWPNSLRPNNKALIDNKYDLDDPLWHKKRWTLKFFRCKENVGGIYYLLQNLKKVIK